MGVYFLHNALDGGAKRGNNQAPTQRVYDFADKLTDEEESRLEALIAEREAQIHCDLVVVTLNEPILSYGGYEVSGGDGVQSGGDLVIHLRQGL